MTTKHALTLVALVGTAAWLSAATPAPAPPFGDADYALPQAQEQSLSVMMIGKGQAGPHLAVPPFVVLTADQATQDQLDAWYVEDGRDVKEHPLHSLYTGLAEKYRAQQESRS